jgi:hypothetical protein
MTCQKESPKVYVIEIYARELGTTWISAEGIPGRESTAHAERHRAATK